MGQLLSRLTSSLFSTLLTRLLDSIFTYTLLPLASNIFLVQFSMLIGGSSISSSEYILLRLSAIGFKLDLTCLTVKGNEKILCAHLANLPNLLPLFSR